MNYGDFSPHISILSTISDRRLSIGALWKETGLKDKHEFHDTLKDLIRDGLLAAESDAKHSQRKFIAITEMGKDIQAIIKSADEYCDGYLSFVCSLRKKILIPMEEVQSNPLILFIKPETDQEKNVQRMLSYRMKNIGWSTEEILYSQECFRNILNFKHLVESNFLFIMMFRLQLFRLKYFPEKRKRRTFDEISHEVTLERLMDMIFELMKGLIFNSLDFKVNDSLALRELIGYPNVTVRSNYDFHAIPERLLGGVYYLLYDIMNIFAHPLPFVLKEEIERVLNSYFTLIVPLFIISQTREEAMKIFEEFDDDIETEETDLLRMKGFTEDELRRYVFAMKASLCDYYMTKKNLVDYKMLKIRSMKLFEKYKMCFLEKEIVS